MIGPTNGKQDVGHLAKWNQILLIEDNVNQVDGPTTKPHSKAARSMAPFDRMHSQVQKSRPPSLASSKGAYGGFHCHMVWKQCKDPGKTCQFHMYIYICIYIYVYIYIYHFGHQRCQFIGEPTIPQPFLEPDFRNSAAVQERQACRT